MSNERCGSVSRHKLRRRVGVLSRQRVLQIVARAAVVAQVGLDLKAAKTLGVQVPQSMLLLADKVIE